MKLSIKGYAWALPVEPGRIGSKAMRAGMSLNAPMSFIEKKIQSPPYGISGAAVTAIYFHVKYFASVNTTRPSSFDLPGKLL